MSIGADLNLIRAIKALISIQDLLILSLGPCPFFRSCNGLFVSCSDHMSKVSNVTKKLVVVALLALLNFSYGC